MSTYEVTLSRDKGFETVVNSLRETLVWDS